MRAPVTVDIGGEDPDAVRAMTATIKSLKKYTDEDHKDDPTV